MVNFCLHILILSSPSVAGILPAAFCLLLNCPDNYCFFLAQLPSLVRLLLFIISVHHVDSTLLSEHVLEEVVQLLGVSPLAP
jgi:hypothetical protein